MLSALNINLCTHIFAKIIVTKIASMTPKLFCTNMLPINFISNSHCYEWFQWVRQEMQVSSSIPPRAPAGKLCSARLQG